MLISASLEAALESSRTATSRDDRLTPLLERGRELEVLRDTIARAAKGTGSLLVVEGAAGIGKTRLLEEAAEIATGAGFLVRAGRGGEMERDLPFGVVRQLFEPLLARASEKDREEWLSGSARRALAALGAGDHDGSRAATDPYAAITGLYWLAANIAARQPLLLVFDDAQWTDGASLRFATFLARRLADVPVAMMIAVRTGEPGAPADLQALRLEAAPLRPAPLSGASVHELIERHTGVAPSARFSAACTQASAGNPFLVMEILRELGSGIDALGDEAAASIAGLAPDHVARTALFRLGRFGSDAVALARAVAVLGRAPQLRYVAELAGLEVERARQLCDELRQAEILAPGLPIEFVHPLVRQAIYLEQPEGERAVTHRRAAELMAATGAGPEDIAGHLLASEPSGDEWVVRELEAAARAAMDTGAYDAAVTYLERALREPPEDDVALLYLLGRALIETDVFRSREVFAGLADRVTDVELELNVLWSLAFTELLCSDLVAAATTFDRTSEVARGCDRELWLNIEAARHLLAWVAGGLSAEVTKRLEDIVAGLKGATFGERVARQALGMDHYVRCHPIAEFVALAHPVPQMPLGPRYWDSPVPMSAAKLLAWSGLWDDARRRIEALVEVALQDGRLFPLAAGYSFLAEVDRLSGRLKESEAHARTSWEMLQLPGALTAYQWSALMNLAATLLARGDVDGFLEVTKGFDLSLGPIEVPVNPFPIELRAHLHLIQGDLEAAVEDLLALGDGLERISFVNPAYPPWRQEATEALAALGRTDEARELISVAEERGETFGAPHVIATVLRARATIEPRATALETLGRSAEILETSGPPHELARSLIDLGGAWRRDGQRRAAEDALLRALDIAARCGAGGLEARARDELAALGLRPRRTARSGVAALTASELKIAKLAADRLNNREIAERLFITRRTVETHLTHVYEKLGIEGRSDLPEALSATASEVSY